MGALLAIGIWSLVAYFVYRRFKRTANRNRYAGQRFDLMPSNAAAILGVMALIPGLWILRVEGWKERTSFNLETGQSSTTSTFGSQFGEAAMYFAIGAALLYAARVLAEKQTLWPPSVQQPLEQLGLVQPSSPNPPSGAHIPASGSAQGMCRFNMPPHWPPAPVGWTPGPGWEPDPSWPPAPPGWQFWTGDAAPTAY